MRANIVVEREPCSAMWKWQMYCGAKLVNEGRGCTSKETAEAYARDAVKCFCERQQIIVDN